jgi:RNA polymerase sigma-70 factor (ECF subfamily)
LVAERCEALDCAVLRLLEKLLPTERAAYVLRVAFNYPYREIAGILGVEEANARQLMTRAREHVSGGRHAPVSPEEQARLRNAFVAAARTGELAALERLFASNVVSTAASNKGAPILTPVR